jgi:hypothetical protein
MIYCTEQQTKEKGEVYRSFDFADGVCVIARPNDFILFDVLWNDVQRMVFDGSQTRRNRF